MAEDTDEAAAESDRPVVMDADVLYDGPLFADEIGWPGGIPDALVEQYDLDARRLILAKEANKGVCSIYFRGAHWEPALIRYAHRYRALLELILRQGLSGERRLLQQGWFEEDLEIFFEIIPGLEHNEHSPVVYRMVLLSLTTPGYIDIARELAAENGFTPRAVLDQVEGTDTTDSGFFDPFIRHHLIEVIDSSSRSNRYRGKHKSTTIGVELDERYRWTEEGKSALPAIVEVYESMIERGEFEPLDAPVAEARAHLPDEISTPEQRRDGLVDELMEKLGSI